MSLDKLLYLQGVGAEFIDCDGQHVHISWQDRLGMLQSMCRDRVNTPQQVLEAPFVCRRIEELDARQWTLPISGFIHGVTDNCGISVYFPAGIAYQFELQFISEQQTITGLVASTAELSVTGDYRIADRGYLRYWLPLQALQLVSGYYQLSLQCELGEFTATLLVSEGRAYLPADAQQKHWGVSLQLYALRSSGKWQIGDFIDLYEYTQWLASKGAGFILLNPLHALSIDKPDYPSPYSPSDRRYINPLYIRPESIAEAKDIPELSALSAQLSDGNWLDYPVIFSAKYQALRLIYQQFLEHASEQRKMQWQVYLQREGAALEAFCAYELLHAPDYLQDAGSGFFAWCQFIADEQLAACQALAKGQGMPIGLVRDLAVGAIPGSSEVSRNPAAFLHHCSVGAPPDPFAPQGQDWGLVPPDPIAMRQQGFKGFIGLVRANLRHCGALRIDHVMALLRLWCSPLDKAFGQGAYIYYPLDTLLAILTHESQRAKAMVIGEDLGVVPPEMPTRLADAQILSNQLFYFNRDAHGFFAPDAQKVFSQFMLANHDVPTWSAWWQEADLDIREKLTLDPPAQQQKARSERRQHKQQLLDWLAYHGNIALSMQADSREILLAVTRVSAGGTATLLSLALSDLSGQIEPVNIPGTWKEYPNWRRRDDCSLAQLQQHPFANDMLETLQQARTGRPSNE